MSHISPVTSLLAPARWLYRLEWRRGFFDWARSDGVTWVYIFKVLFAAFLTLWLAMRLELPQPRTAMITVFIVMQPQSGQVFAKSFYRFLGTLAGSVVMVALIALFAQNTEPFLACLAVWVGLCSAGAARYRNFRAYGFVLAGYTAAMIGLPALAHPEGAFMAAVWRVLEISLGILCATLVSAAILPQTASAAMRNALYQRFGVFALFVTDGLRGRSKREAFEARNVGFIAEAVGLESLRSVTVFEDPHMRRRNGRLSRLNSEFMGITTRFNALHQLLERLRSSAADHVVNAIKPGLQTLAELLDGFSGRALTDADAARLAAALAEYKAELPAQVRRLRALFQETAPSDGQQLDFHTAYELLYRFVDDLHGYALTHASLADHSHERERWDEPFVPQTNWLAATASGVRAAFILLVLGSYWVATAWPSGATMTMIAAATVGLSAATPNPKRMAFQMACGTLFGALIGFVEMFFIFPLIDGFPLLCVMLAPVIMLGSFLSSRPKYAGVGLGLLIFFSTGSVPDNLTVYNPYAFINDYIAMILGMLVCRGRGNHSAAQQSLVVAPARTGFARASGVCHQWQAQGPGIELRKWYPRLAAPGLRAGSGAASGATGLAALDVRGAGGRPRDYRAAQGTGDPASASGVCRKPAVAPGDSGDGAGAGAAVPPTEPEQSGACPGGGGPRHRPRAGHRRTLRPAFRHLGPAPGEKLSAFHPHLVARPAIALGRLCHAARHTASPGT